MSSRTFLIVGATGNTGQGVVKTLAKLIKDSAFSDYKILAQTRSAKSALAQEVAASPGVEVVEKNWLDIDADWLRQHNVARVFIASHNEPTHFAQEGQFLVAALQAGVEYLVRISTTAANVRADFHAYYPRSHWALEAMLSTPEFKNMSWSSLQPNVFFKFVIQDAVNLVKKFRETGKQSQLRLLVADDTPTGVVDGPEVGNFAAHLLVAEDVAQHNQARYVINGPEDITGRQIVQLVEREIGTSLESVTFKDVSFIEQWADQSGELKPLISSIKSAPKTAWDGLCSTSTTSDVVKKLAPPSIGLEQAFKDMLEE